MAQPVPIYAKSSWQKFRQQIAFLGNEEPRGVVPVGIEAEYLLVDRKTKDLTPVGPWLISGLVEVEEGAYQQELYQTQSK